MAAAIAASVLVPDGVEDAGDGVGHGHDIQQILFEESIKDSLACGKNEDHAFATISYLHSTNN